MKEQTDEDLMAAYRDRRDRAAFAALVDRYLDPAVAVGRQILGDAAAAEDAAQDAFMRLLRSGDRYRETKTFSNWFYTILRNVCVDMIRKNARRKKHTAAYAHIVDTDSEPSEPDAPDIERYLSRLPVDLRSVLVLRIVEDMRFADIAAVLGISEEAAKKRAQRALRRLRAIAPADPAEEPDKKADRPAVFSEEYVPETGP